MVEEKELADGLSEGESDPCEETMRAIPSLKRLLTHPEMLRAIHLLKRLPTRQEIPLTG